jgi:hypothetical protein
VQPALIWLTTRPEVLAGLTDQLPTARADLTFHPADPGPLLTSLDAVEPDLVQAGRTVPSGLRGRRFPEDAHFGLCGQRGQPDLELTLWFPEAGRELAGWPGRLAERLAHLAAAGLLPTDDVRRALEHPGGRPLRFRLPRGALARSGALWAPGTRVEVQAGFDLRPNATVRAARLGASLVEVSVGWQDEGPADEPLIDAVVADLGADRLVVTWDCGFAGAVTGYTGVLLCANATPDLAPSPGAHDVHIMIDRRSRDPVELARGVAARSGATVDAGRAW